MAITHSCSLYSSTLLTGGLSHSRSCNLATGRASSPTALSKVFCPREAIGRPESSVRQEEEAGPAGQHSKNHFNGPNAPTGREEHSSVRTEAFPSRRAGGWKRERGLG